MKRKSLKQRRKEPTSDVINHVRMVENSNLPAGIQHQNDVVSTSMRRDHVASTLIRRHFNVVCPLGSCFSSAVRLDEFLRTLLLRSYS